MPVAVAAALWLASGLVHVVSGSNVYVDRALGVLVPTPTNALMWTWPLPWSLIALLLAAASVAAVVAFVLRAVTGSSRDRPAFTSAWFAIVVAGAVIGLAIDAVAVLSSVPLLGRRAVLLTSVDYAVVGAYWGLVQGWIPALVASRRRDPGVARTPQRTRKRWTAAAAIVALAAFAAAGTVGADVDRLAIAEENAIAEGFPPELGAVPDVAAPGTPPPTAAPSPVARDRSWCTPEQAMLLQGAPDAATGHRVFSIRLMNFSDAPCVVSGYPDLAFADQNGHELAVTIDHGSSFMADDAGPRSIEVPAQGYAIAFFGWDANATAGALVARTVYAAQSAGDQRGSWPVTLDIVAGSTVHVTAWQPDPAGPASDSAG